VGSLKWAMASVVGVILTILLGIVVAGFLRIVDLKREI
jgi:putative spermidine/putrescine transport system permease protein